MQQDVFKRPKASLKGILLLFGVVLPVGIMIGGLASFISRFIYLIIVFPALMGVAAGFFINSIVVKEKIRSTFVLVATAIFSAILIFGSMHFFDYLQFRNSAAKEIQAQVISESGEAAPDENVQAYIDYVLVEETGFSGFIGFFLLEAKEGISISRVGVGGSDNGINLGALTWLYWLAEMGFIGWMSVAPSYKLTKDLFCEHCDTWVAEGEHIGGVQPELFKQAIELIKCKDFAGLAQMLQNDTSLPSVEFYKRTCKTCNTFPFYLTASVISSGKQGQVQSKLIMVQALTSSERFTLLSTIERKDAEPAGY
ncbi:MAG TPA: hypothetical protein VFQ13_06095 [Anaerolineales bacterium]|nr:hypothetical protein [Anaerolineales bacterium]